MNIFRRDPRQLKDLYGRFTMPFYPVRLWISKAPWWTRLQCDGCSPEAQNVFFPSLSSRLSTREDLRCRVLHALCVSVCCLHSKRSCNATATATATQPILHRRSDDLCEVRPRPRLRLR